MASIDEARALAEHIIDCSARLMMEIVKLESEIADFQSSFDLYDKASRSLADAYKRAHPEFPQDAWPDATKVNVWAAGIIDQVWPTHFRVKG